MLELKKAASLTLCLFSFMNVFSQGFPEIETVVEDDAIRAELLEKDKVSRFFTIDDNSDFMLLPQTKTCSNYSKKWKSKREDKPNFTLESIYRIPAKECKSASEEIARIQRITRSVSKLEGITYYSQRRGKICTLYHRAYRIDNLVDRNKVDDNLNFNDNPIYTLFEDNSFGEYTVELNYGSTGNEVFLDYVNCDSLGFQLIKAIDPKNMLVFLDVVRCKNELVVYVFIQSKADVSTVFKKKIYTSFVARSDALYQWLKNSY